MIYITRIILTILFLLPVTCFGQENLNIVVTSSWTAAYVELAGIKDYEMMAPADMQHPSEYELQIDDIMKLKEADLIVCGGYETMMEKIRTGLEIDPDLILQIKTDYNLEHIRSSVQSIAERAGTDEIARNNLKEIEEIIIESRNRIKKEGISEVPMLVQFFLRPLSEELDLNITAIFGPRQLEAFDIQELMKHDFEMVIDNAHNPSGQPLAESKDNAKIVYLMNFPGLNDTHSIADVIRKNVDLIINTYNESN
jgi:hypothetical protein